MLLFRGASGFLLGGRGLRTLRSAFEPDAVMLELARICVTGPCPERMVFALTRFEEFRLSGMICSVWVLLPCSYTPKSTYATVICFISARRLLRSAYL